jgi:hypothetical protein
MKKKIWRFRRVREGAKPGKLALGEGFQGK